MSELNRLTEQLFRHMGGTRGGRLFNITAVLNTPPNFGIGGPAATQPGGRYFGLGGHMG